MKKDVKSEKDRASEPADVTEGQRGKKVVRRREVGQAAFKWPG